jgi:hypothetical protein
MTSRKHEVLLSGVDEATVKQAAAVIWDPAMSFERVPWGPRLVDSLSSPRFGVVVTGYPADASEYDAFLDAVRGAGSGSTRVGLILLAARDRFGDARRLVGRGVNRVIPLDQIEEELLPAIVELFDVAPRTGLRLPARITSRSQTRYLTEWCETENLSTSGMLVRSATVFPAGTKLEFALEVPREALPIRGEVQVCRVTDRSREGTEGFGARFVAFRGPDETRLTHILDAHSAA